MVKPSLKKVDRLKGDLDFVIHLVLAFRIVERQAWGVER